MYGKPGVRDDGADRDSAGRMNRQCQRLKLNSYVAHGGDPAEGSAVAIAAACGGNNQAAVRICSGVFAAAGLCPGLAAARGGGLIKRPCGNRRERRERKDDGEASGRKSPSPAKILPRSQHALGRSISRSGIYSRDYWRIGSERRVPPPRALAGPACKSTVRGNAVGSAPQGAVMTAVDGSRRPRSPC